MRKEMATGAVAAAAAVAVAVAMAAVWRDVEKCVQSIGMKNLLNEKIKKKYWKQN